MSKKKTYSVTASKCPDKIKDYISFSKNEDGTITISMPTECSPVNFKTSECKNIIKMLKECINDQAIDNEPETEHIKSHSEKDILNGCIGLMQNMFSDFLEYLEYMDIDIDKLYEDDKPKFDYNYSTLVEALFLRKTSHGGGGSTSKKCSELGVDHSESIAFKKTE